jgi:hypothetical protein
MRHAAAVLALLLAFSDPALAYLKFGVSAGGRQVTLKWAQTPVRYAVTTVAVTGVTATDLQTTVQRAFDSWQSVPTSTITYQFTGVTNAVPGRDDGISTLGFANRPDLDRVLASTSFVVDAASGTLVESDIFFNSTFSWSVAANGETGRFDLESIALHEIGHMSGHGHSALGETQPNGTGGRRVLAAEAVMFPIAFSAGSIAGRTLKADDIAGISDLYPGGDFAPTTGSVSGRVLKNGTPVYGAHVIAFNASSGKLIANFSLNAQGQFSINGLSPGPHILRVEPLDDADVESFLDPSRVDINFQVAFADRVVVVPRGGDSGSIDVKVVPK